MLDYTVVTGFFKYLWKLLRENPVIGILSCVLTFFGFPFVSAYLFFKAWARKSIHKKVSEFQKRNEEFSEYEEVKEDDFLVLPKLDKQSNSGNTPSHSSYDELFK